MKINQIEKELNDRIVAQLATKTDEIMAIIKTVEKQSGDNGTWVHAPVDWGKPYNNNDGGTMVKTTTLKNFILELLKSTYQEKLLKVRTKELLDKIAVFE